MREWVEINKKILLNILGLGFLNINKTEPKVPDVYRDIKPVISGKKVKLTREYPLTSANITKGKVYDVVEEHVALKQVTSRVKIPITFLSIINDNQEVIMVSEVFLKMLTKNIKIYKIN